MRETFFTLLRPYFSRLDDFINKRVASNGAFFDKYFLTSEYLEQFEAMSEEHYRFASVLIKST